VSPQQQQADCQDRKYLHRLKRETGSHHLAAWEVEWTKR
jgi:hypothetical protein